MIPGSLIEHFFEAAFIQRWNDHVRPVELTELDKQAHKMIIAYILAKFEETERKTTINWLALIEGALFEFLHRLVLTDIKPSVFHKIMKTKGREMNSWVIKKLSNDIETVERQFSQKFQHYFMSTPQGSLEKRILQAAHYLATNWEFHLIYPYNHFIHDIERTKEEIENQIEEHSYFIGVQKILLKRKTYQLINFCGQLRLQQRWANSPRLPKTSVLGHMLIVAMIAYICAVETNATDERIVNIYFGGLFHDLPEIMTRDIISPIKSSVEGIKPLLHDYEDLLLEEKILPFIPLSWHEELRYFIKMKDLSKEEIQARFKETEFTQDDAKLLIACDHLSAFIEASLSQKHGISSRHLNEGRKLLFEAYQNEIISGIDFSKLFKYFMPS